MSNKEACWHWRLHHTENDFDFDTDSDKNQKTVFHFQMLFEAIVWRQQPDSFWESAADYFLVHNCC